MEPTEVLFAAITERLEAAAGRLGPEHELDIVFESLESLRTELHRVTEERAVLAELLGYAVEERAALRVERDALTSTFEHIGRLIPPWLLSQLHHRGEAVP